MNLAPITLELATAGLIVVVLVVDLAMKQGRKTLWLLTLAGTIVLLALAGFTRGEAALFGGAYVADGLAWLSKMIVLAGTAATRHSQTKHCYPSIGAHSNPPLCLEFGLRTGERSNLRQP